MAKTVESNLKRYGVPSTLLLDGVKEKIKNKCMNEYGKESYAMTEDVKKKRRETNMKRFGHEYPSQVPEIMDKVRKTNIERYGVETALESEEILETMFDNNERKYGVRYLTQLKSVKEKTIMTNLHKYGVEHHSQAEGVKEKIAKSLHLAGTAVSSKQQRYLCDLYSGVLTYPVGSYIVDIAFPERKIAIEYDGGGHWLSLKLGNVSIAEFEQSERKREATIRYQGWKIARIISRNDLLPSDDKLIEILNIIDDYFKTDHTWINFDIDKGMYRCAIFNEPLDYGDLRRVQSA
jgi:very-short-patch-repair endonuclease